MTDCTHDELCVIQKRFKLNSLGRKKTEAKEKHYEKEL